MLQCVLFLFVIEGFRHFGKFWGILMLLSSREREILKVFCQVRIKTGRGWKLLVSKSENMPSNNSKAA